MRFPIQLNAESISKLLEYTTTDVISEMSNLEKTQLLNRVEHYEQLTANGTALVLNNVELLIELISV